jgi:ribosomal protein S10
MPFVTKLTLESGDRHRLEDVVTTIKETAARKGVELKGPHPHPPDELRVPQHKRLVDDGDRFQPWAYTVYTRTIEVVGHDEFAREITARSFPTGVHIEVDVERVSAPGS